MGSKLIGGEDRLGGFGEGADGEIRRGAQFFGIAEINKHGADAGALTAIDVAPTITNHPRAAEVETEEKGGVSKHAGGGFAPVVGGMVDALAGGEADFDVIDRGNELTEPRVHRIDDGLFLGAAANVRLVRGYDQNVAGGGELRAGGGHAGEQLEFREGIRRVRFAVADDLPIQRAVAVKKDRWAERAGGRFTHKGAAEP